MQPLLMPYQGADVPHAVIEVNQACNIRCRACYKDKYGLTKPLAQVQDEIDVARRARRLNTLTLAGGEPTLHPELPAIVRHAARGGLHVQMLSNGLGVTEERLRALKAAGLSKVYLHVDSLQERPDAPRGAKREADLDPLRDELVARVTRAGLHCALSVTLYRDNLGDLPQVVDYVLTRPDVHRLLVTCCTDFDALADQLGGCAPRQGSAAANTRPGELVQQRVTNAEVEAVLATRGMRPYAYIGSSRSDEERRWIIYYSFAVHGRRGGPPHVVHADEAFGRVVRRLNALSMRVRGSYPFGRVVRPGVAAGLVAAWGAAGGASALARAAGVLARAAAPGARLRQKSFVFQQGPNVTADGGVEWCKDCPDATVRGGRLVPVCMADLLSPIDRPAPAAVTVAPPLGGRPLPTVEVRGRTDRVASVAVTPSATHNP